ncbi:MAG TPA: hypothetical protein VGS80_11555 [Ktedonobacterales bacterium]|nr:hypothetical protein [Ktedonobacterales bacterium]
MIWLTWRQHRSEGLLALGVLVVGGVYLLITGLAMTHTLQDSGLGACLAQHPESIGTSGPCGFLAHQFLNQYGPFIPFAVALLVLPILLGVMVGAPLVAREYEQRTRLLVWMQSVTRTRWVTVTLALVVGAGLLAAGVLLALLNWWYHPFDLLIGKFNEVTFDFTGPVFLASSVMALAVGIAVGTLTRRTVLAIFLTLALIVAIRIVVEFNLRPNYEPQIVVTWPFGQDQSLGGDTPPITLGREDWQIDTGYLDAQGNRTNGIRCNSATTQTPLQCAQAAGYRGNYLAYQPASRFWTFQWIETGIYFAISALALGLTVWWVRKRLA